VKNKFLLNIIDNIRYDYDEFSEQVQTTLSHNNNSFLQTFPELSHFKKGYNSNKSLKKAEIQQKLI